MEAFDNVLKEGERVRYHGGAFATAVRFWVHPADSGRMKLLLLLCLAGVLDRGLFELELPAPLNLTMSSVNFNHELRWTAAPDSPPGLRYHVSVVCSKRNKVAVTTKKLWTKVDLTNPCDIYTLCVRSSFKGSKSPWTKRITFTPYLDTKITAPNVTLSGCGKCIQMNITFPVAHKKCEVSGSKIYPTLSYKVYWRQKLEEEAGEPIQTENQTVIITHLLQGTEYCVQVQPIYQDLNNFQPSSWQCVFTNTGQPPSPVFAVVGSVTVLVVVSLSALFLIVIGLQYTGIICKVKEALPHTLRASSGRRSLLRLEKTIPEPLFLLPETERQQHGHSDQEEEHLETSELEQMEDQEDGLYMDRCADLSSDSSSKCCRTSSFQSAATVIDQPGSQNEMIAEQKDEHSQVIKNQEWVKKESKDCIEIEEWHKELEKYESVNLFSVTITALDLQSDQESSDVQPLVHTPELLDIGLQQPVLEDDSADQQTQNYYMSH